MVTYREDEDGKWEIDGVVEMLVEPSDLFAAKRKAEDELAMQQEWLDSLIPTEDEVRYAENELQTITLLMEVGLL